MTFEQSKENSIVHHGVPWLIIEFQRSETSPDKSSQNKKYTYGFDCAVIVYGSPQMTLMETRFENKKFKKRIRVSA